MKKSQEERIIYKLRKDGFVTRNEALKNYISRLGAIICELKKQGFIFDEPKYIKTKNGRDYRYDLISAPSPQGKLLL